MPETKTIQRARKKARQGRAPSTQAGEFVREEIRHIRKGRHGARSARQAIAIGLSKARRAGVPLAPRGAKKSKRASARPSAKRARALSRFGRGVARKRGPLRRKRAARKAVRTRRLKTS